MKIGKNAEYRGMNMKIIKPSIEWIWSTPSVLGKIELSGRTCYKSESRITVDSSEKFVKMLLDRGHEAMIEHASASYRVICDRGVTHEIVRHRLFSYAQESTRYVNYQKKGMEFIKPCFWNGAAEMNRFFLDRWRESMRKSESDYNYLIDQGAKPQEARSVLPNSLKTEIVITGNLREWRHFFKLRCDSKAHPQMREIANMILKDIKRRIPIVFDDF